jgi:hypothetical protein
VKLAVPSPETLLKYGLTLEEWIGLAKAQHGLCAVCGRPPKNGRLVTDHVHVKNWKRMPPDERKRFVRCLACGWCNRHLLDRTVTLAKARGVVAVLSKELPFWSQG